MILRLRRERHLGVKSLRIELERLHGLRLAASTLRKVLARHELSALPRKRRVRYVPKRYSRPGLGQFTAIDGCSRYLVAALAPRRSATAALTFLEQMFEDLPFAVQRVRTDRGTEFLAEAVQRRLMAWSVKFRPIPPSSPHLNGKVERAQRTVLEEFWATVDSRSPDVVDQLSLWVHHYNWHRPHEGLGGLRQIDPVCERADETPIWSEVAEAYGAMKERVQIREHAVEMTLRKLKRCLRTANFIRPSSFIGIGRSAASRPYSYRGKSRTGPESRIIAAFNRLGLLSIGSGAKARLIRRNDITPPASASPSPPTAPAAPPPPRAKPQSDRRRDHPRYCSAHNPERDQRRWCPQAGERECQPQCIPPAHRASLPHWRRYARRCRR